MEIFAGVVLLTVGFLLALSTGQQWMTRKFIPDEAKFMHDGATFFLTVLTASYFLSLLIVL